ncbi:hypothetical protein [Rhodococcus koreensis]
MYRGWLRYGDAELGNTARLVAHLTSPDLVGDPGNLATVCPPGLSVEYDDSWTGFAQWMGHGSYEVTGAPWYDASQPESAEFLGIWPMLVEGLDSLPIQREVSESIGDGGSASYHRDTTRRINVSALLVGCTNTGVRYGLRWLTCQLRSGRNTGGMPLQFLASHPGGSETDPNRLHRTMVDVVYTGATTVGEYGRGYAGEENRQGTVLRVDFELAATTPYAFGRATVYNVEWEVDDADGVTFQQDCPPGDGSCEEPVTFLTDPNCPPTLLPAASAIRMPCSPATQTCVPLCEGRRRVWTLPTAGYGCGERVVDILISNESAFDEARSIALAWVPCGENRECDRISETSIGYIPPGGQIILDGIRGRARAVVGDREYSASSLVARAGGGPWRPELLDGSSCYELVMDTDPATEVTVSVISRVRDS